MQPTYTPANALQPRPTFQRGRRSANSDVGADAEASPKHQPSGERDACTQDFPESSPRGGAFSLTTP